MKKYSYEKRMDKSITEVKMYVLLLAKGTMKQDIHDIVNSSIDVKQMQRKLKKRQDLSLSLFMDIKRELDKADSFTLLEEHLVYMNLLLDSLFPPVVKYKYRLFQYIVENYDFTVETYCILRHLIRYHERELPSFISYMCERVEKRSEAYHALATEIFCIEHMYDDAYEHLRFIPLEGTLTRYRFALYQYSPYQYKKVIENKKRPFLQMLFNK